MTFDSVSVEINLKYKKNTQKNSSIGIIPVLLMCLVGDHCYKRNSTLSDREQMITALPDIQTATLEETDTFMVLACDGIW